MTCVVSMLSAHCREIFGALFYRASQRERMEKKHKAWLNDVEHK